MIRQQYLQDKYSNDDRQRIDIAIEQGSRFGLSQEAINALKQWRAEMQPQLVPYDPVKHK